MADLRQMLSGFDPQVAEKLIGFVEKHHGRSPYRKVAVFDADGTLWRGDIGEAFFRHQIEKGTIPGAPKKGAWEKYLKESCEGDTIKAFGWLAQWNAGVSEPDLRRWCDEFFRSRWLQNVFPPMRELTHALLNAGFEVWVVSGSVYWIVEAAGRGFGIQPDRILGTRVAVDGGIVTDRMEGIVPYREGKAKLVKSIIGCAPLFAAGNTYWDKELMDTGTELVLTINSEGKGEPNHESEQRMRRLAEEKGWLIQQF